MNPTQHTPPRTTEQPGAVKAEAHQITQQLTANATEAVNALSVHLQNISDKPRMYKANQALRVLWEIE